MTRVVTGIVLATVTLTGVLFAPSWLFWLALAALAVLAAGEMRIFVAGSKKRSGFAKLAALAAPFIAFGLGPGSWPGPWLPIAATLFLFAVCAVASRRLAFGAAGRGLFLAVYLGLTFGSIGAIFEMTVPDGRHVLLVGLIAVYAGDTAAYYGGRRFGRRKLALRISPGKTVEGAAFGVAGAGLAALLACAALLPDVAPATASVVGVMLGAAGIVGDLIESAMKRSAGVKDSGTIFPGHGGLLDRIDSFLFAAPFLYLFASLYGQAVG